MPAKPAPKPKPKRKPPARVRTPLSVSLSPESHATIGDHMADNPDLWTKSAALDDLIRIAREAKISLLGRPCHITLRYKV